MQLHPLGWIIHEFQLLLMYVVDLHVVHDLLVSTQRFSMLHVFWQNIPESVMLNLFQHLCILCYPVVLKRDTETSSA